MSLVIQKDKIFVLSIVMPMETVSFSHPWPAELVQLDIDVFVALGCPAADTAKELTNTIPLADSINE